MIQNMQLRWLTCTLRGREALKVHTQPYTASSNRCVCSYQDSNMTAMGTSCWFPGPIQSLVEQNTYPKIRRPNQGPRKNNNLKGNEVIRPGLQQPLAFRLCGIAGEKCQIHSLGSSHHSQVLHKSVVNLQETYDN